MSKHPARSQFDRDTVLVRFRPGVSAASRAAAVAAERARLVRPVRGTAYFVVDSSGRDPAALVRDLRNDARVAAAQLNYIRRAFKTPNDPAWAVGDQDYLKNIRMPSAWGVTTGSTNYNIAVVDTGVDLDHPDLKPHIKPGRDVIHNDSKANDANGHGTMVAGIAGAVTNNGRGIAGTAWNAGIIPVKVLDSTASGTDADVATGIRWAADHGAKVINLSLGGPDDSPLLHDAIDYARGKNVVVVAAAGNDGTDTPMYPAAYNGVIAVGATDNNGNLAYFSSHGWWVDVSAPGINLVSTYRGTSELYAIGSGTSFAAPIVSGIALLVRWEHRAWSTSRVARRIRAKARDFGPAGIDQFHGWGRADGYAAVGGPKAAPASVPPRDSLEPNGTLDQATALADNADATLSPEGDVDWFEKAVTTTGSVTFTVTPPPADPVGDRAREMDPVLTVYGPDLRLVARADDFTAGEQETVTVAAETVGNYYLAVSNYFGSRTPGSYAVAASTSLSSVTASSGAVLWVRDATPSDFSTGVSKTANAVVTFARDIDPDSIGRATAWIRNGRTWKTVAVTRTYDATDRTLTLDPSSTLAAATPYVVFVSGLRDTAGVVLDEVYSYRFTTAS